MSICYTNEEDKQSSFFMDLNYIIERYSQRNAHEVMVALMGYGNIIRDNRKAHYVSTALIITLYSIVRKKSTRNTLKKSGFVEFFVD